MICQTGAQQCIKGYQHRFSAGNSNCIVSSPSNHKSTIPKTHLVLEKLRFWNDKDIFCSKRAKGSKMVRGGLIAEGTVVRSTSCHQGRVQMFNLFGSLPHTKVCGQSLLITV